MGLTKQDLAKIQGVFNKAAEKLMKKVKQELKSELKSELSELIEEKFMEQRANLEQFKSDVLEQNNALRSEMKVLRDTAIAERTKLLDLEIHHRKYNLLITGIPESPRPQEAGGPFRNTRTFSLALQIKQISENHFN